MGQFRNIDMMQMCLFMCKVQWKSAANNPRPVHGLVGTAAIGSVSGGQRAACMTDQNYLWPQARNSVSLSFFLSLLSSLSVSLSLTFSLLPPYHSTHNSFFVQSWIVRQIIWLRKRSLKMETEKRYTTVIKHCQHDQILALVRQKRHTDTDSFGILQYCSKVKYRVFLCPNYYIYCILDCKTDI